MNQGNLYEFLLEIASLICLMKSLKSLKSHEIRLISLKSNDFEISYKFFVVSDPSSYPSLYPSLDSNTKHF